MTGVDNSSLTWNSYYVLSDNPEGKLMDEKLVVRVSETINIGELTPSTRVALDPETKVVHLVLSRRVDQLVQCMKLEKVPDTTFDMIVGLNQQICELKEVVLLPITNPEVFERLGIAPTKCVVLYGPPGNGKTMLARAVAHHCECTFVRACGTEFVQGTRGGGVSSIKEIFQMARNHAPAIIFIDEIDSFASASNGGFVGGHAMVHQAMSQFLCELEGFDSSSDVIVVMLATNRLHVLDKSLLSRIGRKIEIPNPSEEARLEILKAYAIKMNITPDILMKIVKDTSGASAAHLKAICTEAGILAVRRTLTQVTNLTQVTLEDFEMAVDKVMKEMRENERKMKKMEENMSVSMQKIWI